MNKLEKVTDVNFTLDDGTGRIGIHRWWVFFLVFFPFPLAAWSILGFDLNTVNLFYWVCNFWLKFRCFSIGFVSNARLNCAVDRCVGRMKMQQQMKWLTLSEFGFLVLFVYLYYTLLCKRYILDTCDLVRNPFSGIFVRSCLDLVNWVCVTRFTCKGSILP